MSYVGRCGESGFPGVIAKVSTLSDWIIGQIRPFPVRTPEIPLTCPTNTDTDTTSPPVTSSSNTTTCTKSSTFGDMLSNDCWSASSANTKIVGGSAADEHEYPYQVFLLGKGGCGGSILTSTWILTAAHCVYNINFAIIYPRAIILYNSSYLFKTAAAYGRRIIIHPQYYSKGGGLTEYDIALIELCQPLDLSLPGVQPICITDQNDDSIKETIATGWGRLQQNGTSQINLQEVTLDVISNEECATYYSTNPNIIVPRDTNNFVCTYTPNKDTCQGDSGGPIVAKSSSGCWRQLGLTSYGDGCAKEGAPGIYTRVSAFSNWLRGKIMPYPPRNPKVTLVCSSDTVTAGTTTTSPTVSQNTSRCSGGALFGGDCWSANTMISSAKIVGGVSAKENKYPYHVGVITSKGPCGGSIISSKWILTAASCVYSEESANIIQSVFVGYNSTYLYKTATAQVNRIIVHPNFYVNSVPYYVENNIALIELCQPLDLSLPGVQSVCFAPSQINDVGVSTLTGWGKLSASDSMISIALQEVQLDIVDSASCQGFYNSQTSISLPSNMSNVLCSSTSNKAYCEGDVGGPVVKEVSPGCWLQTGIVSYGKACEQYGIITRVSSYKDWICQTTKQC